MFWIIKISLLAFSLSLLLSMFSESILNKSNIYVAMIMLVIFSFLNIFSDMIGLAITSCQIDELKKENLTEKSYNACFNLITNADKASSILCDVIGDICGILCGVSSTMIAMIFARHFEISSCEALIVSVVTAIVASLTVLFKAIAKAYAVNNSIKILKKIAGFSSIVKRIFSLKKR